MRLLPRRSVTVVPLLLLVTGALVGATAAGPGAPAANAAATALPEGDGWYAGAAVQSINPTPAMIAAGSFYLGGYGLGNGTVAGQPVASGRSALGVLGSGSSVRALALGDGRRSIVTAQLETQGYFIAYKVGDYGLVDIRRQAAADIKAILAKDPKAGPPLSAAAIVIDSNHTHAGPDTAGVWGGVPTAYLQLVKDQTVKAIVEAWRGLRPVDLTYATAMAGVTGTPYDSRYPAGFDRLMTNQFTNDPNNQSVDDEVRVLRATDKATGQVVTTYVNFSAHATVLGGGNRLSSGDYTGPLADLLAADGGVGFPQVGTLGREQPNRGSCAADINTGPDAGKPQQACLSAYAARVNTRVHEALATAVPVRGKKIVALSSFYILDTASNAVIIGLNDGGFVAGADILRATTPPWTAGNVIGTVATSGRIGDLVISGNPGEPYPQIPAAVRSIVTGKQGYFSLGTAGDFLGYIIYPFSAYPEPIRRSVSGGGPIGSSDFCALNGQPQGCVAPIGNDNFFFNVSQTFGQRLVCTLLRGATLAFPEDGKDYASMLPPDTSIPVPASAVTCAGFASDTIFPPGFDTTFSSTSLTPGEPTPTPSGPTPVVPEAPYALLLLLAGGAALAVPVALHRRHRSRAAR